MGRSRRSRETKRTSKRCWSGSATGDNGPLVRDLSPPEQMPLVFRPLRVVPDANVFTGRAWVDWLLEESEARRIDLYWSPKIIEELSRVRLWIWIKQTFRSE